MHTLELKTGLVAPGVYDALTARLVEEAGFEAAYLSGAGIAYTLGYPDIGLVSMSEVAQRLSNVAQAVRIPIIADGDDGHGTALNVIRTVERFEAAGAAAIQLEDQAYPKRCGHLAGKRLVPTEVMVKKLEAAQRARSNVGFKIIARTDARSVLGLDAALERAKAYRDTGADVLFVEAPQTTEELENIARTLPDIPLVANMVEGGKTPLIPVADLKAMGYRLILFPNSLTRTFVAAGRSVLTRLQKDGQTGGPGPHMASFTELNQLVGRPELAALEDTYVLREDDPRKDAP